MGRRGEAFIDYLTSIETAQRGWDGIHDLMILLAYDMT